MKYDLTNPCGLCPFRNDQKRLTVSVDRMLEMASGEFCCHKTAILNEETCEYNPTKDSQHCAGALIFLEHMNQPHQMMRIRERLGMYDRSKLNMSAPVFSSIREIKSADANRRNALLPWRKK